MRRPCGRWGFGFAIFSGKQGGLLLLAAAFYVLGIIRATFGHCYMLEGCVFECQI